MTLEEYHNLYVKTGVLLLADIFQNFWKLCLQYYSIHACHVALGLSQEACFKMRDVKLELLTDINLLMIIEDSVREGVLQISHHFAMANISSTPGFNKDEDPSYIMYWDTNNLYVWSMSEYLSFGRFEQVDATQFNADTILALDDEAHVGYIFEVQLKYPSTLHTLHNDYPLAAQRMTVTEDKTFTNIIIQMIQTL